MRCNFTEQVSLLIDGELPADEASGVEHHLVTCDECRAARTDFLNLRREISDYPLTLNSRAQDLALAKILSSRGGSAWRQSPPGWRERVGAAFGVPRFATALATTCALLIVSVIGFMIYRSVHRDSAIAILPASNSQPPTIARVPEPQPSPAPQEPRNDVLISHVDRPTTPNRNIGPKRQTSRPDERDMRFQPATSNQGPNFIAANAPLPPRNLLVSAADAETLTAQHVEQSSLLLRAFRNARLEEDVALTHEKNRARQLLYQNILLRREATQKGNVQLANLLDSLEPILIDIANLPARPVADEVTAIQQRMERKNLVPLLQVNSTQLARAF